METKPTTPKKPTAPDTEHLEPLHDTLEETRQALVDLCESLVDTDLLSSWQCEPAYRAWHEAAEEWNEAVLDAAADVEMFISEHSDRWMESTRGKAYEAWEQALRDATIETEPLDELRLSLSIDLTDGGITGEVDNADDVLPETPDVPELDA
jgi:hypothetical protein